MTNELHNSREMARANVQPANADARIRRKRKHEDSVNEQQVMLRRSDRSKKPKRDEMYVYD